VRRWRRRLVRLALAVLLLPPLAVAGTTALYRFVQPPMTTLQFVRLVEGYGFERRPVSAAALGPHLPRALIAAEDNRFCRHRGVDWDAFVHEVERWLAGERPRGASTITMQLTRNLFLWPDRSRLRKGLELVLAPLVDLILPKERQLSLYLNQVEFAPGVYGAEAGARHWYDESAAVLSASEAARLIALLPAPLRYRPADAHVGRQAGRIVTRIDQLGPLLDCAGLE
jgi:monofunctional biosynthetic peptidoglycan transglycosylase